MLRKTPLHFVKRPNRTEIIRSNILERTGVIEIGLKADSRDDIGPFGIGAMRKTLLNLGARTSADSTKNKGKYPCRGPQPRHLPMSPSPCQNSSGLAGQELARTK